MIHDRRARVVGAARLRARAERKSRARRTPAISGPGPCGSAALRAPHRAVDVHDRELLGLGSQVGPPRRLAEPRTDRGGLVELGGEAGAALAHHVHPEARDLVVEVDRRAALGEPQEQVVVEREIERGIEVADLVVHPPPPERGHLADVVLGEQVVERVVAAAVVLVAADPAPDRAVVLVDDPACYRPAGRGSNIRLGYDAQHMVAVVDDGDSSNAIVCHEMDCILDVILFKAGNRVVSHDIPDLRRFDIASFGNPFYYQVAIGYDANQPSAGMAFDHRDGTNIRRFH